MGRALGKVIECVCTHKTMLSAKMNTTVPGIEPVKSLSAERPI